MYCKKCGHEMEDSAAFCPKCGTAAGDTGKAVSKFRIEAEPSGVEYAMGIVLTVLSIPWVMEAMDVLDRLSGWYVTDMEKVMIWAEFFVVIMAAITVASAGLAYFGIRIPTIQTKKDQPQPEVTYHGNCLSSLISAFSVTLLMLIFYYNAVRELGGISLLLIIIGFAVTFTKAPKEKKET